MQPQQSTNVGNWPEKWKWRTQLYLLADLILTIQIPQLDIYCEYLTFTPEFLNGKDVSFSPWYKIWIYYKKQPFNSMQIQEVIWKTVKRENGFKRDLNFFQITLSLVDIILEKFWLQNFLALIYKNYHLRQKPFCMWVRILTNYLFSFTSNFLQ